MSSIKAFASSNLFSICLLPSLLSTQSPAPPKDHVNPELNESFTGNLEKGGNIQTPNAFPQAGGGHGRNPRLDKELQGWRSEQGEVSHQSPCRLCTAPGLLMLSLSHEWLL